MPKIIELPVVVVCWTQNGCPACEGFLPTFNAVAKKYERCVPSVVVAADDHQGAADLYRINETPTTTVLRYGRRSTIAITGAVEAAELDQFYSAVARGCEL